MSNSLWNHGLQHTWLPCPSPTPRVYSNSCPLSQWCHPTILSSVIPFSSHLQSFPASGSFSNESQVGLLLFSHCFVWLFETQRTAARQASLSITIYWSLLKLMSIESVMPSNHLVLYCPLLLLPSIFPSNRIFKKWVNSASDGQNNPRISSLKCTD